MSKQSSAPAAKPAAPAQEAPTPAPDGPPFLPEELTDHLWTRWRMRRSPRRLAQLRMAGGGPPYQRDGNVVRYPRRLADQWAAETLGPPVSSTAEEAARYPNNFADRNARAAHGPYARASAGIPTQPATSRRRGPYARGGAGDEA